jgi:hypothetical protein
VPDTQLFHLPINKQGPWGHGTAYADGRLSWHASTRRGLQFDASVRLDAGAQAVLGGLVFANLTVGADAQAAIAIDAAFPLDLFDQAGLVARGSFMAEAAAWIQAEVGLSLELLEEALAPKVPAPWNELLALFLRHTRVEAGLAGRASVSIEATAELILSGALLPAGSRPPGFTCTATAGAGYGTGTGFGFVADLSFASVDRFLDELSDLLAIIVRRVTVSSLAELPDAEADALRAGLPFFDFGVPFAVRTCFNVGRNLVGRAANESKAVTAVTIVEAFCREATEQLLRGLVQAAVTEAAALFPHGKLAAAFEAAPDEEVASIRDRISLLWSSFTILSEIGWEDPGTYIPLVIDVAGVIFDTVYELLDPSDGDVIAEVLATIWATAGLLNNVVTLATDGASLPPCPQGLLTWIEERDVGHAPGTNSWGMATAHIIGPDGAREQKHIDLIHSLPGFGGLVSWLQNYIPNGDKLLTTLLQTLLHPSNEQATGMLHQVALATSDLLTSHLDPLLANATRGADPEQLRFVNELIRPLIRSVPAVLTKAASLGSSDEATIEVREMVSVALLQTVGRLVLVTVETLLDQASTDGVQSLNHISSELAAAERDTLRHELLSWLSQGTFGATPTIEDLQAFVSLAADTLAQWDATVRPALFPLLEDIMAMNLTSGDAAFDRAWGDLSDPADVPMKSQVDQLAQNVAEATVGLAAFALPRIVQIFEIHYNRLLAGWLDWLHDLVEAAVKFIDKLVQDLKQILVSIEQLAAELTRLTGVMACAIAGFADSEQAHIDAGLSGVHDRGWELVKSVLSANPIFAVLSADDQTASMAAAQAVYDQQFAVAQAALDVPLSVIRQLAQWTQAEVDALIASGGVSADQLTDRVMQRVWSASSAPMRVPIVIAIGIPPGITTINLGTVELPAPDVLGVVASTAKALGSDLWRAVAETASSAIDVTRRKQAAEAARDQSQAPPLDDWQFMFPSTPISIAFPASETGATVRSGSELVIVVRGGNSTFVNTLFTVPPRVRVFVDGRERGIAPRYWAVADDGTMTWKVTINPPATQLATEGRAPEEAVLPSGHAPLGRTLRDANPPAELLTHLARLPVWTVRGNTEPEEFVPGDTVVIEEHHVAELVVEPDQLFLDPGIHALSVMAVNGRDQRVSAQLSFIVSLPEGAQ